MKLKYLFLSVCMAGFFTACSTDEVPTPSGGDEVENVSLSMGVTEGGAATKAVDPNALEGERNVNRLTLIVMRKDTEPATLAGKVYVKENTDSEGALNFIGDLNVPAGTYDILIVANAAVSGSASTLSGLTTREAVLAYMETLDQQVAGSMLMTSKLYTNVTLDAIEGAEVTHHYLYNGGSTFKRDGQDYGEEAYVTEAGAKVMLTRQMARIDITGLTFEPSTEHYTNAKFRLEKIYIANARSHSLIYSAEAVYEYKGAGALYYTGKNGADFDSYNNWICPSATYEADYNLLSTTYTPESTEGFVAEGALLTSTLSCYVFENHATRDGADDAARLKNTDLLGTTANPLYDTRVVIEGTFESKEYPFNDKRYYHIPIREKGNATHWGVRRNHIYKVSGTIKGIGWPGDDGGPEDDLIYINSQIEVADWIVVEIDDEL